jgi:hypothetical protein
MKKRPYLGTAGRKAVHFNNTCGKLRKLGILGYTGGRGTGRRCPLLGRAIVKSTELPFFAEVV